MIYLVITIGGVFVLWVISEIFTEVKFRMIDRRLRKVEAKSAPARAASPREGSWAKGKVIEAKPHPLDHSKEE